MYPTRPRLIITGLFVGALALGAAACGSGGQGVQARQAGDTTATTATTTPEPTTTTAAPATAAGPAPTVPPTAAAPAQPPCTAEALGAAYAAKFGNPAGLKPQQCVSRWATSSTTKGFDPPTFTLYRAEGDHWVALNKNGGKLCEGQGVPKDIARQIGCDT